MRRTRAGRGFRIILALGLVVPGPQLAAAQTTSTEVLFRLAQEYLHAGLDAQARRELRRVITLTPHHRQAHQELALIEQRQQHERQRAMERTLQQALAVRSARARRSATSGGLAVANREPAELPPVAPKVVTANSPSSRPSAAAVPTGSSEAVPAIPEPAPVRLAQAGGPSSSDRLQSGGSDQPWWVVHGQDVVPEEAEEAVDGAHWLVGRLNRRITPLSISGEVRSTIGITRDDLIFQEANGDLNERNFRILSGPAQVNTFDPRTFSRLRLNIDTTDPDGFQLHSNVTVDPWSFVGKSDRFTVVGDTPTDSVELELKWWSATNTAINETVTTLRNGDSISTPEIEVVEGRTVPTRVTSTNSNVFQIPAVEIEYTFQPIRWFWTGYRSDEVDLRVFPLALEDQALTSNDPLQLSNHHIYWEPSPWLDEWRPGRVNAGTTPTDFTRGEWSDALTFFTRDSDLTRLTALRGTSLQWHPAEDTLLQAAIASPKGLWQDYERFSSFLAMSRLTHTLLDGRLSVGGLHTSRWAYNERRKDATNNVYALDVGWAPREGTTVEAEAALSKSLQDRSSDFDSDTRGFTWHGAVTNTWQDLWGDLRLISRLAYTHMDEGFDPGLANYRHTRDDQFWGRHLKLKRPMRLLQRFTAPLGVPANEIEGVRIGDGVDIGRDVIRLSLDGSFWDGRFAPLVDLRNVHASGGKYIETVVRNENTIRLAEWLGVKTLLLYHDLPDTIAGIDPFIVNNENDRPYRNANVPGGLDPSLLTFSVGAEVAPTEQFSFWGAWERTNDSTLATDNFPRGLLNSSNFTTFTEEGQVIRIDEPFLFNAGFFPLPPYAFFDIFRLGFYASPTEEFEFAVDWTRNEFEHAGQIDDNINHVGVTAVWAPTPRLALVGRYVASQAIQLTRENAGEGVFFERHHNLYGRLTWKASETSDLSIEYGEAAIGGAPAVFTVDPLGDSYPTLDTEHLVRVVYSSRF